MKKKDIKLKIGVKTEAYCLDCAKKVRINVIKNAFDNCKECGGESLQFDYTESEQKAIEDYLNAMENDE